MTSPGIDPETVRQVEQCFNHYATPGPHKINNSIKFTKEEMTLPKLGIQYNLQKPVKSYWTNLFLETERIVYFTTITHFLLYYYILPLQYNIPQVVVYSLMLLQLEKIVARNMSN